MFNLTEQWVSLLCFTHMYVGVLWRHRTGKMSVILQSWFIILCDMRWLGQQQLSLCSPQIEHHWLFNEAGYLSSSNFCWSFKGFLRALVLQSTLEWWICIQTAAKTGSVNSHSVDAHSSKGERGQAGSTVFSSGNFLSGQLYLKFLPTLKEGPLL